MELKHLEALIAVSQEGSFTAAADRLSTVQSNISEQIRQLEVELGTELIVRSRQGATLTEAGRAVLARASRIKHEASEIASDVADVFGLKIGNASFGVVGTASKWLVPDLVSAMQRSAPDVMLRINEGASERLVAEVLDLQLAQAVVTAPVANKKLIEEHLLDERLVGLVPQGSRLLGRGAIKLKEIAKERLIMPPSNNPLRLEVELAAEAINIELNVPIEVEGVRLIGDLVAANAGISILPETSFDFETPGLRTLPIEGLPLRRLVLVTLRDTQLSAADLAVREHILEIVSLRANAGKKQR